MQSEFDIVQNFSQNNLMKSNFSKNCHSQRCFEHDENAHKNFHYISTRKNEKNKPLRERKANKVACPES
jgi:hypothetical protein